MKNFLAPATLCLALFAASATSAQVLSLNYNPRTGDTWIDARLVDIDSYGRSHRDLFIDDIVVSYGAPRLVVRELLVDRSWAPADVYYACMIANQLGRPCLEVANIYQRDRGQGWGAVAKRLGIKPGSAEFHALKGRVGQGHGRIKARGAHSVPAAHGKPAHAGHSTSHPSGHGKDKGKDQGKDKGKGKGKP